jgi:elongation factor P
MGDALNYLEDGMPCEVVFYNGKAISVELPTSVVREVIYTEPAVKGDTSGKVMKPAKINRPPVSSCRCRLFVEIGDKIEIDTRTGEYRNRVKLPKFQVPRLTRCKAKRHPHRGGAF